MTIWVHSQAGQPPSLNEIAGECRFCRGKLIDQPVYDHWVGSCITACEIHKQNIIDSVEIHGEEILRELEFSADPDEKKPILSICPICGWWNVTKEAWLYTKRQIWSMHFGAAATLKKFDLAHTELPIIEVRQYLAANYKNRYHLHPRILEKVVAEVFSDYGFTSELTSYSADGGIDVILHHSCGKTIAVQVKRYKTAIKVASIRELIGAMILEGHTKGAFITTSKFQSGCRSTADLARTKGLEISLIDGKIFFDYLKIAQLSDFKKYPKLLDDTILSSLMLHAGDEVHFNSL